MNITKEKQKAELAALREELATAKRKRQQEEADEDEADEMECQRQRAELSIHFRCLDCLKRLF